MKTARVYFISHFQEHRIFISRANIEEPLYSSCPFPRRWKTDDMCQRIPLPYPPSLWRASSVFYATRISSSTGIISAGQF